MILADEADVLEEAFYRAKVSDISTREYREEDLKQYVDYLGIERDIVPELHPYFHIDRDVRCEKHNIPITSCGCPDTRETDTTIYSLNPPKLMEDWAHALRENDVFDSLNLETVNDTRYVLTARINDTEVTFQCFFNGNDFERYDFEPRILEFGVSFFGDHSAVERNYCYSWRQFLATNFRENLTREIKRLKETIGADFYEYEPLEDFRDRVRQSLRQYFSDSGYEVRKEVGEVCPVETTQYEIDTSKTDFAASKGESDYIVCHCEKTPGWHVHHFSNGQVKSAEQTPVIKDMTEKIESKINTYQDIRLNKQTASRFVTVLATFFSIGFVVLLFERLGLIVSVLQDQFQLGANLQLIAFGLLIFNAIAAIALAAVVTRPYIRDFRFSWKIEPFDLSSGTTKEDVDEDSM